LFEYAGVIIDRISGVAFVDKLLSQGFQRRGAELRYQQLTEDLVEQAEYVADSPRDGSGIIEFFVCVVQVPDDEVLDGDFVDPVEGLSSIGDKLGYNPVVLSLAGFGAILSGVVHFSSDADECSAG